MVKGEATMVEHAMEDEDMTGYFLPEDSQLLLKQLSSHIRFLARLAQPRIADETKEWAPVVGMAELMFCLDQLAEQLELVLKDVSWLEQPSRAQAASDTPQASADTADAPEVAYAASAGGKRLVFGVTLEQIDKLNRLISGIKAYGDAVFADGMADFAEGTLAMLGYTIFDQAIEVNDILNEINTQRLGQGAGGRSAVEEPRAAYGVQMPSEKERLPGAVAATASLPLAFGPSLGGVSLH
jgi:hypothetical protein